MASDSFHWLKDGYEYYSPAVGEETLTDGHIRHFRQALGGRVKVIQFDKSQEGRNGADWEMWIHNRSHGVGLRIQAKKASQAGQYKKIDHALVREQRAYQCDLLIRHAAAVQCIPVYVLYNFWSWSIDPGVAKSLCRHGASDESHYGCTLVSAYHVQNELFRKAVGYNISHKGLWGASLPWNQVLCDERVPKVGNDPRGNDPRGVAALREILKAVQELQKSGLAALPDDRTGITPSHVHWGDSAFGGVPFEEDAALTEHLMSDVLKPLPPHVHALLESAPDDPPWPLVPTHGVLLYDLTDTREAQAPESGEGSARRRT
ncbi:DUF6615 family protein [Streptomyces olivoreticuli]